MLSKWILIAESAIFGLVFALCIPMWAMVPMLFGVTEFTSSAQARPLYVVLLAFPLVTAIALTLAWRADPNGLLRWIAMVVPLLHLSVLFAVRINK